MKKVYILIGAVVAAFTANSQSLSPTVIASSGAYVENQNVSLSYTVGEMTMVETFSANGNILTQGFQQPEDALVGIIELSKGEFGSFAVYPNPAVDHLWYGFTLPQSGKVNISLFNELGQKIGDLYNSNYASENKIVQPMSVSTLSAGIYFMTMTFTSDADNQTHVSTEKFQVIR